MLDGEVCVCGVCARCRAVGADFSPVPAGLLAVAALQEAGGHQSAGGQRGGSRRTAPAGLPALHQPPAVRRGEIAPKRHPRPAAKGKCAGACGCSKSSPSPDSCCACLSSYSPKYREGDVTLFALNLYNVSQTLQLPRQLWSKQVDQYLLLPHGKESILSR